MEASELFSDLPKDSPAYPYAINLFNHHILHGYPDGSFQPDGWITRAEMAALLVKAGGFTEKSSENATFPDVGLSHWANGEVETAAEAGLVRGYPDGTFKPDKPVTRAETAALLLRLAGKPYPRLPISPVIKDVSPTYWASQDIAAALDANLLVLADKETFAPERPATRAQFTRGLAFLMNLDPDRSIFPLRGVLVPMGGEVTMSLPGQAPQKVSQESVVESGDVIETGSSGRAEIRFPDGSGLLIMNNTSISIKEARGRSFIRKDGSSGVAIEFLRINLLKGKIYGAAASGYSNRTDYHGITLPNEYQAMLADYRFEGSYLNDSINLAVKLPSSRGLRKGLFNHPNVFASLGGESSDTEELAWWQGAYAKEVKVEVDMPWGVASVRGTFWMNDVQPEREATSVLDGVVEVTAAGCTVVVKAGEITYIDSPSSPPTTPSRMFLHETRGWRDVYQWAMKLAHAIQDNLTVIIPPLKVEEQSEILKEMKEEKDTRGMSILEFTPLKPVSVPEQIQNSDVYGSPLGPNTQPSSSSGGSSGSNKDTIPPGVKEIVLPSGSTGVSVDQPITIKFSENIIPGSAFEDITLINKNTGDAVPINKTISGNALIITPAVPLANNTQYEITIPAGALADTSGNPLGSPYKVTFKTQLAGTTASGMCIVYARVE